MGWLLQSASDRAGHLYWERISPEMVWAAIWLTVAFCAIHALRRARTQPPGKSPAGYNLNQRLYHWGNLLLLIVLTVSGYFLFFRRAPGVPFLSGWGVSWLDLHIWSGLLFIAGVALHAWAAITRGDWSSMVPSREDLRGAVMIWKNFLGRTSEYPTSGKYDALQKIYHHVLVALAVTFAVSGVWMWLSAERIYFGGRDWLQVLRVVHDLSALTLIVLLIGHIYFSLLKVNRANLKDMAGIGTVSAEEEGGD